MQRYFAISSNPLKLEDGDIHHILHVMRLKENDQFQVAFDGKSYLCAVATINPFSFNVINIINEDVEIDNDITIYFPLAKGDKIDFIIQKCTELGARKIVLFNSSRCIVKMDQSDFDRKAIRYNKIAKEAAEQSHRAVVPKVLGIISLSDLKSADLSDLSYVAYEKDAGSTKDEYQEFSNIVKESSIDIFVGPEGGFSEKEIEHLNSLHVKNISLGKRILRCETAPLYVLSVLGFMLER